MLDITTILAVSASLALFAAIGYSRIATLLLSAYDFLLNGASYRDYRQKWRTLHSLRLDLATISAQDEFARWARLQRRIDAAQSDWDKATQERNRRQMAGKMAVSVVARVAHAVAVVWVGWRWRQEEPIVVPILWRMFGERAVSVFNIKMIDSDSRVTVLLLHFIAMAGFGTVFSVLD